MNPVSENILISSQKEEAKQGRKRKEEGFFTKEKEEKPKKEKGIPIVKKKEYNCDLCGLHLHVKSPKMKYTGDGKLQVLIYGEAGGRNEDEKGIQFIGDAGKLLRTHLRSNGYNLDQDFWKSNIVQCRPTNEQGGNRTPTDKEIKCCRSQWQAEVLELQPTFIFLMGESTVKAFFGERGKKIKENLSISRWRRLCIPDPWSQAWVIPLFHPAFVLRNPDAEHIFARDLKWALGNLNNSKPEFPDWRSKIEMITDYQEVLQFISQLYEEPALAIDYETNRLRPYAPGSEVVSVGVGLPGKGVSFPMNYPHQVGWADWQYLNVFCAWKDFIKNYSGKLLVHNHQMECIWSRRFFGVDAKDWAWDSMLVAHILDERQQYTSLDFQVFIHWGFEYGSEIAPYKESLDKSDDEAFNRMKEAPLMDLLQYNGLDAMFTYKLWKQQKYELERQSSLQPAVDLFLAGIKRFADTEDLGIQVDDVYYLEKDRELGKTIKDLEEKLEISKEAKQFQEKTGKVLKWSSNSKDIPVLLYNILEKEPTVFTPKGKPSANREVIQGIEGEFFENLRELRKLTKLKNTHLKAFLKSFDGRLHPSLTLHVARSLRSSGNSPNFQNLDKHDENSMRLIRGGIKSSPGRMLGAVDYGSHEVRIITCLSQDKKLEKDLLEGIDFHSYFGNKLGVSRYDGKNSFVFAEFYGSYYKSIWKDLHVKGYKNLEIELVREVEKEFWERYHGVREWQNKTVADYTKTGYIEFPWGFKNRGLLTRNMLFNRTVQGSAFHCLLWSMIKTFERKEELNWESNIIFEVHDELLFDIEPDEKEEIKREVTKIMTKEIREENKWISIPLINEWSFTRINSTWSEIKKEEE